jgi:hypothetical protein
VQLTDTAHSIDGLCLTGIIQLVCLYEHQVLFYGQNTNKLVKLVRIDMYE